MACYRNDKTVVAAGLRRGERPDLATTMVSDPLDELVALHEGLGILAILDEVKVQRQRAGVTDEILLRTLATLLRRERSPRVEEPLEWLLLTSFPTTTLARGVGARGLVSASLAG